MTLALTLGGGGARAAYQVGVLRTLARHHPDLRFDLLTGVSAGAINVTHLAQFEGRLLDSTEALADMWLRLQLDDVIRTGGRSLLWRAAKIGMRLSVGVPPFFAPVAGMVDTQPLREFLHKALRSDDGELNGIDRNIAAGRLQGVALTTNSYATGETVTFFRGETIKEWERPNRRSVEARLTIDHIMASTALPLVFPPVRIGDIWYGDGGIRLVAPLAPAVHMGANRLLVISTHFGGRQRPSALPAEAPSPATVLAEMYNSMFLDHLDQDVHHMHRTNKLLRHLNEEHRNGLRQIGLLVIRPSQDLGEIAFDLKDRVPPTLRYLLNRFGGGQSESDDFLSTLLFHPDYVERLIRIGERDAQEKIDEIAQFVG